MKLMSMPLDPSQTPTSIWLASVRALTSSLLIALRAASTPTSRHFGAGGLLPRPFVYAYTAGEDPVTWRKIYLEDEEVRYPIRWFVHGEEYRFWGLFKTRLYLFGVDDGYVFLLGTDILGRDVFSRIMYGTRISLSIGLIGVALSFILGLSIGGFSGYFGGFADAVVQRSIDFLRSLPVLPVWMALAAALPANWPTIRVYFGITVIVSLIGWTGLARVVRSKLLSLRHEDFVMAAVVAGARSGKIISRHLIPGFLSYEIVSLTLAVPNMILSETALSFLGLGLRPPVVSWGVLLSEAQNLHAIALAPVAAAARPVHHRRGAGVQLRRRRAARRRRSLRLLSSLRRWGNQGVVIAVAVLAPHQHRPYQVVDSFFLQSLDVEPDLGRGKAE